jgi:hypothetical protein
VQPAAQKRKKIDSHSRDLDRSGLSLPDRKVRQQLHAWTEEALENNSPIHGAINLETGNTRMLEVATVNAVKHDHAPDGDRDDASG